MEFNPWHYVKKVVADGQMLGITCTSTLLYALTLTKHYAMKADWGSGGIAPLIL
jgi:hypothetical protein